jgi:hypothetical protein
MRYAYMLSLLTLGFSPALAVEATNQWYLRGPDTGYAQRVAIDKVSNKPIAGGNSGVFVFSGGQWQFSNAGAPTPNVSDIAVSAGATFINSGGYVARTTDGGSNWLNVSSTLMNGAVSAVATSAANASRVYAAVNPGDGSSWGGLWISDDLGATWTQSVATIGGNMVLVRVSPTDANLVFVAGQADPNTGIANLFRSTDGGVSFQGPVAVTGGDINTTGLVQFYDLAQDPFDANHMIAVAGQTDPIYKAIYGELWTSSDAGQNWSMTTPAFQIAPDAQDQAEPRAVLFDHYTQGTVYYATAWGVFKSTTGGGSPALSSTGLIRLGTNTAGAQPYDEITHLAQDSDANHTLYAASISDGVYQSTDGAGNWAPINIGYTGLDFRIIAFQPGTNVALAGASDPSISNGVYRSTDSGTTWSRSSTGLNPNVIRGLAFAPAPSTVVLAAGYKPQQSIGGENNRGFWRSTDSGQTWTASNDAGLPRNAGKRIIQFDPNDANRVLLSTGAGIALSTDGGQTWINSGAQNSLFFGLPTQVDPNVGPLGLAAGPGPVSGTRFYAGFCCGSNPPPAGGEPWVYYSDDGGYHWTQSTMPAGTTITAYFSLSATAGTLYVSSGSAVLKSTDYGVNWVATGTNSACAYVSGGVAADPTDPMVVWSGCLYTDIAHPGGIYRSNDGGATWVPYGRGLRIPSILWMTIDPADHNHLLAGGNEGMHEMHFTADGNQNGIADADENALVPGSATQVASAVLGTSNTTTSAPTASTDYVHVQVDLAAPHLGTCGFVSDLQIMGTDIVPAWNSKLAAAPTIRFILPDCQAAHVKITYSAQTSYILPVFGSYSPATPGDATTLRWNTLDNAVALGVDVSGVWTLALDDTHGNVYAPGSGSILFQGAPGTDAVFADGFGN